MKKHSIWILLSVEVFLLALLLAFVVYKISRNELLSYGVALLLTLATAIAYFINSTVFEGLLPKIMKTLSLFDRFETIVNGVFDMTAIVYFLSFILFFLFLSVQSLEKRRYN